MVLIFQNCLLVLMVLCRLHNSLSIAFNIIFFLFLVNKNCEEDGNLNNIPLGCLVHAALHMTPVKACHLVFGFLDLHILCWAAMSPGDPYPPAQAAGQSVHSSAHRPTKSFL